MKIESKLIRLNFDLIKNIDDLKNIFSDYNIPYNIDDIFKLKSTYKDFWFDSVSKKIVIYRLREPGLNNPGGVFVTDIFEKHILSINPMSHKEEPIENMSPKKLEDTLNSILEKISKNGKLSLTEKENNFLKNYKKIKTSN